MLTEELYKEYLYTKGKDLGEVRRTNSAMITNARFTGDVGYKRVYILDPEEGWHWTDAKYSKHVAESILKDAVDYYLQFRPYEHHCVGTYVFVPDDTDTEIGFYHDNPLNPFEDENFQDIFKNGKLWMIVGRDSAVEFVRYNILQCNWRFDWVSRYKGKRQILSVYGCNRVVSSYTSGEWLADVSTNLDTISSRWVPDTYLVFGDEGIKKYHLSDTRYLTLHTRMMITTNALYPQCWKLTKIVEVEPTGILKLTMKRDEFDEKRDNVSLMLCDYYDDSGDIQIEKPEEKRPDIFKTSEMFWMKVNDNGELEIDDSEDEKFLYIGKMSYFSAKFSNRDIISDWRIEYSEENDDYKDIDDKKKEYYCGLLKMTKLNENTVSVRPGRINNLIDRKFTLIVQDTNGEYKSNIQVGVKKWQKEET